MKTKAVALFLALVMLAGLLPTAALAADAAVTVNFTAQQGGAFLFAPQFNASVSAGLAESYGYTDTVTNGVSALDVLVKAHEIKYGAEFAKDKKAGYLVVADGTIEKMFGTTSTVVGFAINGGFPNDGTKGSYGYNGTAVNASPIKSGDTVEFFFYQDTESYLDNMVWFCKGGNAVSTITAKPGAELALTLKGVAYVWYGSNYESGAAMRAQGGTAVCGMQLAWVDAATGTVSNIKDCVTDEDDGTVTLTVPAAGTYYLTTTGTDDSENPAIMSLTKLVSDPNYEPPAVSCDLNSLTVASLVGDAKTLSPAFAADTVEYSVPVQNYSTNALDTAFKVQFEKKDPTAEVEVKHNGKDISEGGGGWYLCNGDNVLKPGARNKLTAKVTASDSTTKIYTVILPMKDAQGKTPAEAKLDNVSFSFDAEGTQKLKMTPAFDSKVTEYTLELFDFQMPKTTSKVYCTQTLGTGVTGKYYFYNKQLGAYASMSGYNGGTDAFTLTKSGTIEIARTRFCEPFKASGGSNNQKHKIVVSAGEGELQDTKEYFFHTIAYPTLKEIKIGNLAIESFSGDKFDYTVAVPSFAGKVSITATPSDIGTASTTKYIVYQNGDAQKTDMAAKATEIALNESGVTTVKLVVEEKGGVTSTYTLTLKKASAADTQKLVMDAIAANYAANGSTDPWTVADMAAYAKASPDTPYKLTAAQKQAYLDKLIPLIKAEAAKTTASAGNLAKYIIALRAMGYDARNVFAAAGESLDAVKLLTDLVDAKNAGVASQYTLPYVLIALQQGNGFATKEQLAWLKQTALDSKADWIKESWGTIDSVPPMVLALAPYADESAMKAVLDEAVAFLKSKQQANGSVGNANSTGITLAGLSALGLDCAAIQKDGKSLLDGLMTQVSATGDGFFYGNSTANNAMATEQGFRGLVAAALQAKAKGPARIYDFSAMPTSIARTSDTGCPVEISAFPADAAVEVKQGETVQLSKGGNYYDLSAGNYTYTVSKSGYIAAEGTFEVTDAQASAHTPKPIRISLISTGSESAKTLNITVKVLRHDGAACGGKWTYKANAREYTSLAEQSITVKAGQSAFDAFALAMAQVNKTYTEKSFGYIDTIDGLAEFDHGKNSGWQYMIDGVLPTVSSREYVLRSDAVMTWFYTDDYTREHGSEQWGSPTVPDTTDPGKSTVSEIKAETKVENGKATVTADSAALNKALESAETNTQLVIKTEVKAGEAVNETKAVLKGADVAAIAKRGVALKVNSPVADIVLSGKALKGLDTTAQVSVTAAKTEQGTRVEVAVGDKAVDKLSGNLTVNLPVAKTELKPGSVMVLVDADGKETVIKKSAVGDDGVAALLKGSCTVKIVDKSKAFEDAEKHWAKDNIAFASSHDLFQGTGEGSFAPNAAMDRGMLATVLYRLEDAKANGTSAFGDVKSDAYYADAVTWANSNAIVSGTDKGFEPERAVTRQELVKMIYAYAKSVGMDTSKTTSLSKYGDAGSVAGWASEPMAWAVANGIVSGRDGNSLAPTGTATRAEVAAIMQRLVGLMVK